MSVLIIKIHPPSNVSANTLLEMSKKQQPISYFSRQTFEMHSQIA